MSQLKAQRLDVLRKIMGINYTDTDVLNEAEGCVEEPLPNLESLDSEYDFNDFCDKLRKYYPSYIRFHQEEANL
jgi:hypothetical protein